MIFLKTFMIAICTVFTSAACAIGGMTVEDLRCEYLKNPLAIDNATPHFSWEMVSDRNGAHSTAYQILVATDLCKLNEKHADLWNSGVVSESSSNGILYKVSLDGSKVTTY
jgi:alpha-L-rhamnosidase